MYFEARSHELVPVADATAAVRHVCSPQGRSFQCPMWLNTHGQRIVLVDDSHINHGDFGECAVVNLDTKRQLESITFAWCDNEAQKVEYVKGCEDDAGLGDREVIVPIGDEGKDAPAQFTCSCCGDWFTSTLREQEPHDQDAGYGHCPSCFPASRAA
jgi:hypothetical protein